MYEARGKAGPGWGGTERKEVSHALVIGLHRKRMTVYIILELILTVGLFQFMASWLRGRILDWAGSVIVQGLECCHMFLRLRLHSFCVCCLRLGASVLAGSWVMPQGPGDWTALFMVIAGQVLSLSSRYHCMFGGAERPMAKTYLIGSHVVSGLLISGAFLSRAGGPGGEGMLSACELRHHGIAVALAGVLSCLIDALAYYNRGYQSTRGIGPFRRPPSGGRRRRLVLARGYDQDLFDLHHFLSGPGEASQWEGGLSSPHSSMLIPDLPPSQSLPSFLGPEASQWARRCGHLWMRLSALWEEMGGRELAGRLLLTSVGVAASAGPAETLLAKASALIFGEDHQYHGLPPVGSSWQALPKVAFTTVAVAVYGFFTLGRSTLLLCHLVRQPVDFSALGKGERGGAESLLHGWLEKGWAVILREPRLEHPNRGGGRRQSAESAFEAPEKDMWRGEMEETQRMLYRTAVLASRSVFPPRLEMFDVSRQPLGPTDRLYRAQAFLDLAILAHGQVERRRQACFKDRGVWQATCRPLVMVVNALTLQIELEMEGCGRVEGGMPSPLKKLHARLGLVEPEEGNSLAGLIVDAEVQRRMEEVWSHRRSHGQPIAQEDLDSDPHEWLLPAKGEWRGGMHLSPDQEGKTAPGRPPKPLEIPTLDLQVVELAASALGALYRNAVSVVEEEERFEDPRGCSRHSIPAVVGSLVGCQLALHLYSAMVLCAADGGGGNGRGTGGWAGWVSGKDTGMTEAGMQGAVPRFQVIFDRPSVVLPQLAGVSMAVDEAIESILGTYYESDLMTFSFAPLYARCLKMYIECWRRKDEERMDKEIRDRQSSEREGGEDGQAWLETKLSKGSRWEGNGSPSLLLQRRGKWRKS